MDGDCMLNEPVCRLAKQSVIQSVSHCNQRHSFAKKSNERHSAQFSSRCRDCSKKVHSFAATNNGHVHVIAGSGWLYKTTANEGKRCWLSAKIAKSRRRRRRRHSIRLCNLFGVSMNQARRWGGDREHIHLKPSRNFLKVVELFQCIQTNNNNF